MNKVTMMQDFVNEKRRNKQTTSETMISVMDIDVVFGDAMLDEFAIKPNYLTEDFINDVRIVFKFYIKYRFDSFDQNRFR